MIEFDNVISFIENSTGDEKNGFLLWAHTYNRGVNAASLTEYYKHLRGRKWIKLLESKLWEQGQMVEFLNLVADFMETYEKYAHDEGLHKEYSDLKKWIKDNAE